MILERGPKKELAQISALLLRMNNLEEVTEENFCELATKDARMGNIVLGVYRCFIGDVYIDASLIYMLVPLLDNRIRILSSASPDASLLIFFLPLKKTLLWVIGAFTLNGAVNVGVDVGVDVDHLTAQMEQVIEALV